jgi:hypothetical protein
MNKETKIANQRRTTRVVLKLTASVFGVCLATLSAYSQALSIAPRISMNANSLSNTLVVSDNDLGNMRGRFLDNGVVSYFGIELVSYWVTADGSILKAGVGISGQPNSATVKYVPIVSASNGSGTSSNNPGNSISNSGGLDNIHGISQSIQVTGVGNKLGNTLNLTIVDPNDPNAQTLSSVFNGPQGQVGNTYVATNNQGDSASASFNGQVVQTLLLAPGQGQVLQQVNGIQGLGNGITQRIAVQSNFNTVQNIMNLTVSLNAQNALSQANSQISNLLLRIGRQ